MDSIVIGIDLGTTFSAVAYIDESGRPRIIKNADGKSTTPSVVLIEGGRVVVGELAMNQWVTNQEHVVRWVKRAIGDAHWSFRGLDAVQISAEILKALKADAEMHFGHEVKRAVITCPAYFNSVEIENTKKAGELAGFEVQEIMKEPTAAALYYGIDNMRDGERIMVCDLGGGTFDSTVLLLEHGKFTPLVTTGDRELGGHDWTSALEELVGERAMALYGVNPRDDLVARQMLYEECEKAKRDFARSTTASVPVRVEGKTQIIPVTREEFEERTEALITRMVMRVENSLEKGKLAWAQIDKILLVGGSSRLRRMAESLQQISGKAPIPGGEPDLMVVYGAAILAKGKVRPRRPGGLSDSKSGGLIAGGAKAGGLIDADIGRNIARALGTRVIDPNQGKPRIVNSQLIPHSTPAPVDRSRDDFQVASNRQQFFDLPVVEFENQDEYDQICNYRVRCLPGAQRGDRVRVTFHYDKNGIISVEAFDVKTGQKLAADRADYTEPNLESMAGRGRPRWVVFAVDVSGSMEGEKIENARQAVAKAAADLLDAGPEATRVGIVTFSSSANVACRPTANAGQLTSAARGMTTHDTTAMDRGIGLAAAELAGAPDSCDRLLVMVTDGMPDDKNLTVAAASAAKNKGISIYSLGIGKKDVDEAFLNQIADKALVIDSATDLGDGMATLLTLG